MNEQSAESLSGMPRNLADPLMPFGELHDCSCCPRDCHADRFAGGSGYCGSDSGFSVAAICNHRGEEPIISGESGICNIFFSHCNMRCLYCQNFQISRRRGEVQESRLTIAEIIRQVESILDRGSHAVGFVSPSHCIQQVRVILDALIARGARPVFLFNTNSYDKVETIKSFDGEIDVWLPDLKYLDSRLARAYSDAPNYPEVACAAIREMFHQKGSSIRLDEHGRITSGLIIRHLVLPGAVENSKQVLRWIAEELSPAIHISLMSQYQPTPLVMDHPLLSRTVTPAEYDEVLAECDRLGFYRGWIQQLDSADNYQPDFRREHPFES
ncbi:MAG: radical SAM protein [bacterium]